MNQHDCPRIAGTQPPFRLLLVTDRTAAPSGGLIDAVDAAVRGGVDAVMLRDKDLPARERIALGLELRAATRGRATFLVNGSTLIAQAVNADGLHLPDDPQTVRPQGWSGLLGYSAHAVDALERATTLGAAYVLLGTVFPSRSHPGGPTGGLDLVRAAAAYQSRPALVAIGGITTEHAAMVVEAGADGIAVISAILAARDPEQAARDLHAAVGAALGRRPPTSMTSVAWA